MSNWEYEAHARLGASFASLAWVAFLLLVFVVAAETFVTNVTTLLMFPITPLLFWKIQRIGPRTKQTYLAVLTVYVLYWPVNLLIVHYHPEWRGYMLDPEMFKIHKDVSSDEVFVATWIRHWVEVIIRIIGFLSIVIGAIMLAWILFEQFVSFLGRRFYQSRAPRRGIERE
jgi:hypothetical protein